MRKVKYILALFVLGLFFISGHEAYAGPSMITIPQSEIPADTPDDVREQILRLYSSDVEERRQAANALGYMRERAAPAIPFLIETLGDDSPFDMRGLFDANEEELPLAFTPRIEAMGALMHIGKPAVGPLIDALKNDRVIR